MAAAGINIAEGIIRRLVSLAIQETVLQMGVKDEFERLRRIVSRVQAVLVDLEERPERERDTRSWLGKVTEVLYEIDDLVDNLCTEILQRQVITGNRITKEVRLFFSRSNQLVYGLKLRRRIKAIRENLDALSADRQMFALPVDIVVPRVERRDLTEVRKQLDPSTAGVVVGREREKEKIIASLLASNNQENVSIISIVGMRGSGKTALARLVFNDDRVSTHFDIKLWVDVGDDFDVEIILKQMLLESATNSKSEDLELKTMKNFLDGKRYLLVLDDVWIEVFEQWHNLMNSLWDLRGANGSRIVATTRSAKVASIKSNMQAFSLEGLSEEQCWSLFKKMAFDGDQLPQDPYLEQVGRECMVLCKGLPLAVKTIGSLLYFQKTREERLSLLRRAFSEAVEEERDILPALKWSYDFLPLHLKHCFAYCSLFPKNSRIDVKTLIHLWIGQGFIMPSDSRQSLEDIGLECFMDLWWRSFFHEVEKDKLGNIKSCKMHDLIHDLAMSVAGIESCRNSCTIDTGYGIRHVSFDFELDLSWEIPKHLRRANRLRTFLLPGQDQYWWQDFASNEGRWKKSNYDAISSDFVYLRVFDLHNLGIEELSPSISKLKSLRYLDVSKNYGIRVLPNSITQLQNLQVLKLCYCEKLKELPKDIAKLVSLRHLDCSGCLNLTHMPYGLGKLTSLVTLSTFIANGSVFNRVGGLDELKRLNNLSGRIEIINLRCVKRRSAFEAANLKEKQNLQSLMLRWNRDEDDNNVDAADDQREIPPPSILCMCSRPRNDNYEVSFHPRPNQDDDDDDDDGGNRGDTYNDDDTMSLESLELPSNLKELEVYDYEGVSFPRCLSSLRNLVYVTIKNCRRCQHLPPLDEIHTLKSLIIWNLSDLEYIDNKGDNCLGGGGGGEATFFPSLKEVRLLNCPNLKRWGKKREDGGGDDDTTTAATTVELPQFPCLSTLVIHNCPQLTWMPLFPSLSERLWLINGSIEPLKQTMGINAASWASLSVSSSHSSPSMYSPLDCPLSKLKILGIERIENLETLPEEWLQNLTFLQQFYIEDCPRLTSLPRGMHHCTSLRKLDIRRCPHLKQRIGNKDGVDWPNIKRIPNIIVDRRKIQWEDYYPLDNCKSSTATREVTGQEEQKEFLVQGKGKESSTARKAGGEQEEQNELFLPSCGILMRCH